jgi:hypothetical protein
MGDSSGNFKEFYKRAGPSVKKENGQLRHALRASNMDEVNPVVTDRRLELGMRVEAFFVSSPVVIVAPTTRELTDTRNREPTAVIGNAFGPPRFAKPSREVGDRRGRNAYTERLDGHAREERSPNGRDSSRLLLQGPITISSGAPFARPHRD